MGSFTTATLRWASLVAKIKVIVDQDARGPGTSDQQAILAVLIQSPQMDVLGITIVSGDQWRDEEVTQHVCVCSRLSIAPIFRLSRGGISAAQLKKKRERWKRAMAKLRIQGLLDERWCARQPSTRSLPARGYSSDAGRPPHHSRPAAGTCRASSSIGWCTSIRTRCVVGGWAADQPRARLEA